jgi:hypothetical protein
MDFSLAQDAALGAFGIDVTITPAGGVATAGRGIFRSAHQEIDPGTGAVVLVDQPTLDVKLDEVPNGAIARGDLVAINGTDYRVTEVRKDGEGMASLRLMLEP